MLPLSFMNYLNKHRLEDTLNITKEKTKKGKNTRINSSTFLGKPYKVILFNDNFHDMDEVTYQIMQAINCPIAKAVEIMYEAHNKGQATVFTGTKERCELVQNILQQIDLLTDLIQA
jgi:ATP-dependent Clp protease adaptor protein ClpS